MPQAQGGSAQLIYQSEATYKTSPAADAVKLPFISESVATARNLVGSQIIRASRNPTKFVRGRKNVAGSINTELSPYMGTLLVHLLGAYTAPGGLTPFTHTIKMGTLPVSFLIEKGFTDIAQYFLYNGCRIQKGHFEFKDEGFIPFNFDIIGAKETIAGTSFDATSTDLGHLPFESFEMTIEEGGSSLAIAFNVVMDIVNNLDGENYVIGGLGERRTLPAGTAEVSGTLTALFEDLTLYNKAVNYTESSLRIILTRGTGLGSAGNESLEFKAPELVYEQKSPLVSGPKGVMVDLAFRGFYDNAAEATACQAILKNTQATIA